MINARAVDYPASGRSVFYAYNDFARDIQTQKMPRVKISLWSKMVLCLGKNKFLPFKYY